MLSGMGNIAEIKQRLAFVFFALIVYRIGTFIPIPGVNPAALQQFFDQNTGTILGVFNMFSGGALQRLSVFALGIMPYISTSIIMQLLVLVFPKLKKISEEEGGKKKIQKLTSES